MYKRACNFATFMLLSAFAPFIFGMLSHVNTVTSSVHYAEASNSGSQTNVQDKVKKLFQEVLGPVLLLGILLSTLSFSSPEHEVLCLP
jgi:hypothetical protein